MRKYVKENTRNMHVVGEVFSFPAMKKMNSFSKPVRAIDLLPRANKEIGVLNPRIEQMKI